MKVKQLFESQFDTLSTSYGIFYIYKNPTNKELNDKHYKDTNNRSVIDEDGNLYIVKFWPKENDKYNIDGMMLHYDLILYFQSKHNLFSDVDPLYANKYQSNIVLVQQARGTKDFYLSELYMSANLKSPKIQEILNKAKIKNPHLNFVKKRISSSI
jgi:hypothetical protein